MTTEEKIKKAIEKVRPMLQGDGGDVQFVNWDEKTGIVDVTLIGVCSHCPMAHVTLSQGIASEIKQDVPEVKEVRAV